MKASDLIHLLLPSTKIDVINLPPTSDGEDEVLVEVGDMIYLPIKEVYFLANPNRTIIRLENGETK